MRGDYAESDSCLIERRNREYSDIGSAVAIRTCAEHRAWLRRAAQQRIRVDEAFSIW